MGKKWCQQVVAQERAHAVVMLDAKVAVHGVASAMAATTPGPSYTWRRRIAAEEVQRQAKTITAYGPVVQVTDVQGKTGLLEIEHTNPFALLMHASESVAMFRTFMAQAMQSSPDGIVFNSLFRQSHARKQPET